MDAHGGARPRLGQISKLLTLASGEVEGESGPRLAFEVGPAVELAGRKRTNTGFIFRAVGTTKGE